MSSAQEVGQVGQVHQHGVLVGPEGRTKGGTVGQSNKHTEKQWIRSSYSQAAEAQR